MSNDGRHKQMLADLADFLGAVAWEDDKGWTEEVYAEGWSAGFRSGLAYAAKIAQSQGRGVYPRMRGGTEHGEVEESGFEGLSPHARGNHCKGCKPKG